MKFVVLGIVLFVVLTFSLRKRGDRVRETPSKPKGRKGTMFSTDDDALNVRSADNVRLISDDQIDAIDPNGREARRAPENAKRDE